MKRGDSISLIYLSIIYENELPMLLRRKVHTIDVRSFSLHQKPRQVDNSALHTLSVIKNDLFTNSYIGFTNLCTV